MNSNNYSDADGAYSTTTTSSASDSSFSTLSNFSTSSINSLSLTTYIFIAIPLAIFLTLGIYGIKNLIVYIYRRNTNNLSNSDQVSDNINNSTISISAPPNDIEAGSSSKKNKLPSLEHVTAPSTPVASPKSPNSPSHVSFFSWLTSSSPRTTSSSAASTPRADSPVESTSKYRLSIKEWIGKKSSPNSPDNSSDANIKRKIEKFKLNQFVTNTSHDDSELNYDVEFNPPSIDSLRESLSDKSKKNSNKIKIFNYSDKKNRDKVSIF